MYISPENKEVIQALRGTYPLVYQMNDSIYAFKSPARNPEDIQVIIQCNGTDEYIVDEDPVYPLDETTQPIENIEILSRLKTDLPDLTFNSIYQMHGNMSILIPEYEQFELDISLRMGDILIRHKVYEYDKLVNYLIRWGEHIKTKLETLSKLQSNESIADKLNDYVIRGILVFDGTTYSLVNKDNIIIYLDDDYGRIDIYALTHIQFNHTEYEGFDINGETVTLYDIGDIAIRGPV